MKKSETSRRGFIKITAAGAAVGTLGILGGQAAQADVTRRNRIKIAGYDYDRVRAIMDGQVGIEGAEISFDTENIYAANRHAFGPDRKYEVTELGLIPFIRKYINKDVPDAMKEGMGEAARDKAILRKAHGLKNEPTTSTRIAYQALLPEQQEGFFFAGGTRLIINGQNQNPIYRESRNE